MILTECSVFSLRVFESIRIEPAAGINLFIGENGSGKTSLLEAIYFISRVKSFRTSRTGDLVRKGSERVRVSAVVDEAGGRARLDVERGNGRTSIKADGEPVGSASKQASRLPVLAWLPDSAKLFTDAPKLRRHWLNWSLFHVKPQFLDVWKAYHRALRQRNALLRLARSADADMLFWEQRLCAEAAVIDRLRGEYLSELSEQWSPIARRLSGLDACLSYRRGWEDDTALGDSLRARRALDRRRGCTSSGPHRADVAFQADGAAATACLSRGQMKLYGTALLFGQVLCMAERTGRLPVVLLDDVDAELDAAGQEGLFEELSGLPAQCFAATLNPSLAKRLDAGRSRVFHVKHGAVEVVG